MNERDLPRETSTSTKVASHGRAGDETPSAHARSRRPTADASGDDAAVSVERFVQILLLHCGAHGLHVWVLGEPPTPTQWAQGVAMAACGLAGFSTRARPTAVWVMAALQLLSVARIFPFTSNHAYLQLLLLVVVLVGGWRRHARETRGWLRVLTAVVFFQTGLQKLLHGTYVRGDFFASNHGLHSLLGGYVEVLSSQVELERIEDLGGRRFGAGPFTWSSLPGVLLSNGVWLGEMLLPPFFFFARTRVAAVALAVAMVIGFQIVVREMLFGLLFTALLLMVLDSRVLARAFPAFVGLYGLFLLARAFGVGVN